VLSALQKFQEVIFPPFPSFKIIWINPYSKKSGKKLFEYFWKEHKNKIGEKWEITEKESNHLEFIWFS
jgi:hypothetical protein